MTDLPDIPHAAGVAPAPDAPLPAALAATLAKLELAAAEADPVAMVHEARKAMKNYRALLRLIGTDHARAARRGVSAAARHFAHARDHATAREALDLLEETGMARAADIAAARAAIGTDPALSDVEHLRSALLDFLGGERARLANGLGHDAAQADLAAGLARGYRAARRGQFGQPRQMHATRKRVVTHRYQMSFMATHFDGHGARRASRAQRLRTALGAYQDIETLRSRLLDAASILEQKTAARLQEAMQRLQKRLKRQAQRQHAALFRRRPDRFAAKARRHLTSMAVMPVT